MRGAWNAGVDVAEPASISRGIAERYALALFELAKDAGSLGALEQDVDAVEAAYRDSVDLRRLATSPLVTRRDQVDAVAALAGPLGLSQLTANTLSLMASKRRLFVLPQFVAELRRMIVDDRGELTAEVSAAAPLSDAQAEKLAAALRQRFGREVKINASVDESLIGGLVVKVGSRMIDTSIAARLANLQNAMKEVG